MKYKILTAGLAMLLLLNFTACSFLQSDTKEVKVIPKKETTQVSPANTGDTGGTAVTSDTSGTTDTTPDTKPEDKANEQKSELDDKLQSLQNGTQEYIKSIIGDRATEVLYAIKSKDMTKLAQAAHPDKGIRFSPYGHVFADTDLKFSADQIKSLASDKKRYTWGSYDGSGEPIEMTFGEYYNRFIYDEDFVKAKEVGYNKILGKGNIIINTAEVYPKAVIVEYYFPGFDPQYGGMDWRSLRLAFEKQGTTWYLVGIIHNEWTI